ncbi:DUF2157 domain-containing protein [Cyanobium sp. CH-040]|uniref:DUF2157 domain-containing protein n=1 Tax=Cyanobium sp. CH-040 TaxID=2823708 RepID=UPI0020CE924D|nr:DUF2157 domain-containing protein [Cyanobium sp. CH-040]MCP9928251.1 DUF2157 domain-containing protein [Cyanobium sp. CH-040]
MTAEWEKALCRWVDAGLLPATTGEAITRWEHERQRQPPATGRLGAPIRVLLVLGAVLLAAGVLLFVAAHWDSLPPGWRFALVLALVAGLHGLGALAAARQPATATALHAVGTVALGGGVFLAGQIFHLEANWPAGLMLWSVGAALGWGLLRQWPQLALLVLLLPAWLVSEWTLACRQGEMPDWAFAKVAAAGVLLLALALLAAAGGRDGPAPARQVLLWVGGLALLPASGIWALVLRFGGAVADQALTAAQWSLLGLGWTVALAGPLLTAWRLRPRGWWPVGAAAGWLLAGLGVAGLREGLAAALLPFVWWLLGSLALVAWGLADRRPERVNLGAALAAGTVLAFYASEVMNRLDRSLSLIGLGALCLAGGWLLERLRRRWLGHLHGVAPPSGSAPGGGQP